MQIQTDRRISKQFIAYNEVVVVSKDECGCDGNVNYSILYMKKASAYSFQFKFETRKYLRNGEVDIEIWVIKFSFYILRDSWCSSDTYLMFRCC